MLALLRTKPVLLAVIVLLLMVPLAMVSSLTEDRASYRSEAVREINTSWTGHQTFVGPVVVAEYEVIRHAERWDKAAGRMVDEVYRMPATAMVAPASLDLAADVRTETRYRGIHAARVYTVSLKLAGQWSAADLRAALPANEEVVLNRVYLLLWVPDQRGFVSRPDAVWGDSPLVFEARAHQVLGGGGVVAALPDAAAADVGFSVSMTLRGSAELAFVPTAGEGHYAVQSDWPHPSFQGRYLPTLRSIHPDGSHSSWHTTVLSSNVANDLNQCARGECEALLRNRFAVGFIDPIDQYQRALRATKYGVLFVLVLMGAVIMVEMKTGADVHPVQYGLVGAALAVFFLLLLSLSEHLPFAAAYVLASAMSTALLGWYGRAILGSLAAGGAMSAGVASLFGLLYVILGREDTALLMGSFVIFGLLAALMWVTADRSTLAALRLPAASGG